MDAAIAAGPDGASALGAALVATAAMTSLLAGAGIAFLFRPSQRVVAIIMAFGTGALIHALAIELASESAERLAHRAHISGVASWAWVAAGFLGGGLLYVLGNRAISSQGGDLRHPATTRLYLLEKKREESASVLEELSRVDILRALPPSEVEDLLGCVEPVRVEAGATIFREREPGDALYMIRAGAVEIRDEPDAPESGARAAAPDAAPAPGAPAAVAAVAAPVVLARLGAGQSFGEMALLTGEPRSAAAVAVAPTELLRIPKESFDERIARSPALRRAVTDLQSRRLVENVSATAGGRAAERWQRAALANIQRLSREEETRLLAAHTPSGAPLAIFLGAVLDGVPESVVIGSQFRTFASIEVTFAAAVFLANLPEAMASAAGMREAGLRTARVFALWGGLVLVGALAAALGNLYLSAAPPTLFALVEAVAGGGILAMVSSVMMPEAYEHGGAGVGIATIAGFLAALFFAIV
jgi:CRP-like cAMP-binding protein